MAVSVVDIINPSSHRSQRPVRILGVAGSLRRDSYNHAALRAAQELLPQDTDLELFDLTGIPLFNQDDESEFPAAVREFKRAWTSRFYPDLKADDVIWRGTSGRRFLLCIPFFGIHRSRCPFHSPWNF